MRDVKLGERGSQAGPARGHSGRKQGKIREQPSADRQVLDLLRVDYIADLSARGLHRRSLGGYRDYLAERRDFQRDVHGCGLAHAQPDPILRVLAEAAVTCRQRISTRRESGNHVETSLVGGGGVGSVGIHFAQGDADFDQGAAAFVKDSAVELSKADRGLREGLGRKSW